MSNSSAGTRSPAQQCKARAIMQLVPSVLGDVETAVQYVEAFRIAQAAGIALLGREALACLIRVIEPDASTELEFGARIEPTRMRRAVLNLAGSVATATPDTG